MPIWGLDISLIYSSKLMKTVRRLLTTKPKWIMLIRFE